MENPSQDQNKEQKQSNEITPQSINELESLNNSEELDIESLEEIDGGLQQVECCVTNDGCGIHCWE
ncbi:MAG: hypothetical protein AAF298_06630 [Cyanobacteria bacterium P01_A01_bin.40]